MNTEHLYSVLLNTFLVKTIWNAGWLFKIPTKESCDLTMFYKSCPKYLKTMSGFCKIVLCCVSATLRLEM